MLFAAAGAEARSPGFEPAMLTISTADGRSREVRVQSERQLRDALRLCFGKAQCEDISIETCDRCSLQAEATYGGYLIHSRLGPPGPLYELRDKRRGRRGSKVFGLQDVKTIFVDYLTGRETIPLDRRDTGEI
ncbi:hypothetical protein [Sphingopyxis sp.]|uniref:hypothetical protein n=1 Tax=Sphingopyxis sp. TaxID=1908224 RepID=UPI0035B0469D